jgi:DNA-binding beta-propeller fold protein YncE
MNIIVSACLLGVDCRYCGTGVFNNKVTKLKEKHNLIPVCPEQLGGLSTPRNPVEIVDGKAVDKEGNIYIVDSGNFRVQVFDPDGRYLFSFGSVGLEPGSFARPKGIALDSEGNIYVVDAAFSNFQIFDSKGRVFLAVGTNGEDPGKFSLPVGITIDEKDTIYVVDQMNKRIQVFQYLKDSPQVPQGQEPQQK